MKVWNPTTDEYEILAYGSGGAVSVDEADYWHVKAALLDPAALIQPLYDTFDLNTVTDPLYVVSAWQCKIDNLTNNRYDSRVPPFLDAIPTLLPPGTRVQGTATGSSFVAIDPTLVTYDDPKDKYFERIARLGTLTHRPATATGSSAVNAWMDSSRPVWTSSDPRTDTSLYTVVGGGGFGCTQQFRLPLGVTSGQTVDVSVYIQRVTGQSGDLAIDIRTDSLGNPSGTIMGTVTVLAANLPALDAGGEWVDATITLSSTLVADTLYHLQLRNDAGSTAVCRWRGAYGESQVYYKGRSHSGGTWVDPTGFKHFACAINRADQVDFLVVHASAFDTPWAIMLGELTGVGINLWTELDDSQLQRAAAGIAIPWTLKHGMQYRMNGGSSSSRASWLALELPSDW